MNSVFSVATFAFPYDYKFPGQASDERILFITRENPVMLWVRRVGVVLASLAVLVVGFWLGSALNGFGVVDGSLAAVVQLFSLFAALIFAVVGWWWVSTLWSRSICLVTTKRLAKFIYTTPFNRHVLALPLDMIVDTGSYTKGFLQALLRLGTFTARSAAASSGVASEEDVTGGGKRINRKYFYIENVAKAEDLQHYVSKVLEAHKHHRDHLATFRPFIPHLKGEARREFMKDFEGYWS